MTVLRDWATPEMTGRPVLTGGAGGGGASVTDQAADAVAYPPAFATRTVYTWVPVARPVSTAGDAHAA